MSNAFEKEIAALLPWRKGHFKFESGHYGDTWLDLELLCVQPEPVEQLAAVLADCLSEQRADAICGPLVEGAFVAMMVARRLKVPFTYAERFDSKSSEMRSIIERKPLERCGVRCSRRPSRLNSSTASVARISLACRPE